MSLKVVLTITDTGIPEFSGVTVDLPALDTSGYAGAIVSYLLKGKEADASLTLGVNGDDIVETLTVSSNVPFASKILKPLTENQIVPAGVAAVIKDLVPQGISLAAKISFEAA